MYYFIPSWYSRTDPWSAVISPWYQKSNAYEFDDTINQTRMFLSAGENVQLVLLSYFPEFRHFMHQQNITGAEWWSAFDEMQGIQARRPGILSYQDLPWPGNAQWVFNPFVILVYSGESKYAKVEFAEDGNLFYVDYYQNDIVVRRSIYDDRAFLSSVIYYQDKIPVRQDYFDDSGVLQFTEDKKTGRVSIATHAEHSFRKREYDSLKDMIGEVTADFFLNRTDLDESLIVVAANEQHDDLVTGILFGRKIALSFFDSRFDLNDQKALQQTVQNARFVVTDTEHAAKIIREAAPEIPTYDISPFDTRLSLGKSQRIKELKIFMPFDGLTGIYLEKALTQVMQYMQKNPDVILLLGTRESDAEIIRGVKEEARQIQKELGIGPFYFDTDLEEDEELHDLHDDSRKPRLFIAGYNSENDLIRILYDTRLILDVRDQPDLYLQIAGISAGIPQVNYRFTRYVEHKKDGYIIQNINYITGALEYYLTGLSHWNEALVYCVREISKYTGGNQVQKWKEMMGE